MREIMFRGKRLCNGEWVEGFYVERGNKHWIYPAGDQIICRSLARELRPLHSAKSTQKILREVFPIDPTTAGQYTELKDKSGKRIFEGDICKVGNLLYKVEFKHSAWRLTILSNKDYCCPEFNSHCGEYCEVIGNIHDNPELLEG